MTRQDKITYTRLLLSVAPLVLASCASGPVMPTAPLTCYDDHGKEIPCVEDMDCHDSGR